MGEERKAEELTEETEEKEEKGGLYKWFKTSNNGNWHSDEYYTRAEDIENQLKDYDLKDLKIYAPCDTDESEFVKYFQKKNLTYKNTSDDYYDHEDIYQWADVVITNPPFKNNSKWLRWMTTKFPDLKFILIQPLFSVKNRMQAQKFRNREWFIDGVCDYFNTPEGEKRVAVVWMSNFEKKKES